MNLPSKQSKVKDTQYFFLLKTGPIGCKYDWNNIDLKKNEKKKKKIKDNIFFFLPWHYVSVILRGKVCIAP